MGRSGSMKKLLDFIIRIKYYLDFIDGKISYIPKQPIQMKNAQTAVVELIGLLSQAIDILRNHDAEDDANYIETQMEETIKLIKSK
jgi:hypothetical protein